MAFVSLDDVTVDFTIYGAQKSFRQALFARATGGLIRRETGTSRVTVRALDHVSIMLKDGDRVGLLGHNGAGKSTLLRVIAGVYEPTAGRATIEGRVSPLFNTSPGLDMEDTGYENIITCGLFLGMTREEIARKTPEIAEFSGLGDYLSLPVRTYSTGMLTRLGFAIATTVDPEILLLDEGLGAGDARFAERAKRRVDALVERSRLVVLASHSDELIRSMCNQAILLDGGRVVMRGGVEEVIDAYRGLNERSAVTAWSASRTSEAAPCAETGARSTTTTLRPFYFMVTFWGSAYRGYFTDLLLASLLAPNNIPSLKRERGSKFLICTTEDDWRALQDNEMFQRLCAYVEPIWLEMAPPAPDELKMLVMSRGHKLMASRAFEDRAYGVFLTPDLILSDGSVAAMERLAEAGRKVVLTVAVRFCHETMLPGLEREGYLRSGEPLAIAPRALMRIALQNLHSETRRYEFDAPWFAESPISVYWRVPDDEGILIHSFSWAPVVVDYSTLSQHDTRTFENWTLDGDYIYRNFPNAGDVYIVSDSDEIALVSFTKETDLHFELLPTLAGVRRAMAEAYKIRSIRALRNSVVMDPLKRQIFPTPVYLHAGAISAAWRPIASRAARVIERACREPRWSERAVLALLSLRRPDLVGRFRGGADRGTPFVVWAWRRRRFFWQRIKEKTGIVPGRSRLDDGRDWLSPTLSVMHPIWSARALAADRGLRAAGWGAFKGAVAATRPGQALMRLRHPRRRHGAFVVAAAGKRQGHDGQRG